MKQIFFKSNYLLMLFLLTGCVTQKVSTITGSSYNEQLNETNYMVMPYAAINIPGKWTKANYDNVSRQQFFKNSDSVSLAITFAPIKEFEFNLNNQKKGFEFVQAFYKWEANYFMSQYPVIVSIIDQDSTANYLLWHVKSRDRTSDINNYFLFSEKNGIAHNYCIYSAPTWSEKQITDFLQNTFNYNKQQ